MAKFGLFQAGISASEVIPMPTSTSNPGSGVLFVLALWGAFADWHYVKKGGKPAPKGTWKGLLISAVFVTLVLVFLRWRGASPEALGFLIGTLLITSFVFYEGYRLFVRIRNPIAKYKL